jgi:hypothetical protein
MFGLEGIIGFLFTVIVCAYAVKKVVTDSAYAVRGQIPPRVKLRMAELRANGQTRYGFWDYLRDLWHDSLEDRRRAREARRNDPNHGRGPARTFFSNWWAQFWADAWTNWLAHQAKKRQEKAQKQQKKAALQAMGTPDPVDGDQPQWKQWISTIGDWWRNLFAVTIGRFGNRDQDDEEPAPGPPPAGNPVTPGSQPPAAPGPGGNPPPAPARPVQAPVAVGAGPGGQPLATVIPMFPKGETTMSDAPEVTGLGTAVQYAGGMAQAFAGQTAQTETFIATVQGGGTTGEAIAAATAAMEATNAAAAAWQQAQTVLTQHTAVGEAYGANPGAGDKQFVTAE